MTSATSGKICVLCGEDCSTRPRVKDSHGNYYCKTCHQDAEERNARRRAEREAQQQAAAAPAPEPEPDFDEIMELGDAVEGMQLNLDDSDLHLDDDEDDPLSLESALQEPMPEFASEDDLPDEGDDPFDLMEDTTDPHASAPAVEAGEGVGSEAKHVSADDDVNVAGGDSGGAPETFSLLDELVAEQDQKDAADIMALEPSEAAPPIMSAPPTLLTAVPVASPSSGAIWPNVFGTLALLLGGFGATVMTLNLMANLTRRAQREFIPDPVMDHVLLALLVPGLFILLGAWQVFGGFGVMLKKPIGARALRYWARIVVIVTLTLTVAIPVLVFMGSGAVAQESAPGGNTQAFQLGLAVGTFLLVGIIALISLIWPIIILIWFRREKIQDQIESWG